MNKVVRAFRSGRLIRGTFKYGTYTPVVIMDLSNRSN